MNALESTSTRPYLIRALYEWCTDNGLTPYVAVQVDETVQVPREFVKNGEIVLNISMDATSALKLGNDFIEFKARFAGTAREIMVPMERVIAIYARENGQGMAFPAMPPAVAAAPAPKTAEPAATTATPPALVAVAGPVPEAAATEAARTADAAPQGADTGNRVVQLVPPEAADAKDEGAEPEPPRPPAGGKPALKRVK